MIVENSYKKAYPDLPHIVEDVDALLSGSTEIPFHELCWLEPEDRNMGMELKGDLISFIILEQNNLARVTIAIKEFIANEAFFRAHMIYSKLPIVIPLEIQMRINEISGMELYRPQFESEAFDEIKICNPQDFQGISQDSLLKIKMFYHKNKTFIDSLEKPTVFARNHHYDFTDIMLPYSLSCIPKGFPKEGQWILLKQHNGNQQLGIGGYNRVTVARNLETGVEAAWRSAARKGIRKDEIKANLKVHQYPNSSDHFITCSNFHAYRGNVRETRKDRTEKTGYQEETDKIGSIVDIYKMGNLTEFVQNNDIKLVQCLNIMVEIFDHLDFLHVNLNLVYRDLKPENVIMTEDGHTRITDLGFAVQIGEYVKRAGTPKYIPIEVYLNHYSDLKTTISAPSMDIWSAGVLFLRLIGDNDTWKNEFEGSILNHLRNRTFTKEMLDQFKIKVYDKLRITIMQESPAEAEAIIKIIDQCLHIIPEKRPSAKIVREDIKKAIERIASAA